MIHLVAQSGAVGSIDRLDKKYTDPRDEDNRYLRKWMGECDESVSAQLRDCQFEHK